MDSAADATAITRLAAEHNLDVDPETITVNELGLDFRVAIVDAVDGQRWVLRIPRRAEVMTRAQVEGRVLQRIAPRLSVDVPDWRIHTETLIAYPLLPGEPGLTLEPDGTPVWHFDEHSPVFSDSLGTMLAQLHSLDPETVDDTGITALTPGEHRESIRENIARVAAEFAIAPSLHDRWLSWLADDSYWPERSVLTHGEIYPAHLLLDGETILGVLDWTTASIGDPAQDFAFHRASVSDAAFETTVSRYVAAGGHVGPRFGDHCTEVFSLSPVTYALFALTTEDPEHRAAAAAQLHPEEGTHP
ncbi:macrolide 2'-phosphotransferase [Citricoccus muralis]|uniref:Macrolide 2'-phosphotransferase n=1 Tax=Citricoccus muralis TaxID=169134 RepID=A0ABY8H3N0_9MICC|nr:macrolide 2'-phosphotransferase [Citricoccus muralis]WFP15742.1 macrolide 2'-phosphotransferase [Citricoccus muralis]